MENDKPFDSDRLHWLTTEQVADVLHVSKQTVWKMIREGELPVRKVGRKYLIPAASVATDTAEPLKWSPDDDEQPETKETLP